MIRSVIDFVRQLTREVSLPWLVLGKGPTADRIYETFTGAYHVLTLNHACLIHQPTLAHFVDLEAFLACSEYLADSEIPTCLPWHPHVGFKADRDTLPQFGGLFGESDKSRPLAWLNAKDKLFSYNSTTAGKLPKNEKLPTVRLRHFSAVAAFNLLGMARVTKLYSLGVDGGTGYAAAFDPATKLANGRNSFDAQTPELEAAVARYGMTWTKL